MRLAHSLRAYLAGIAATVVSVALFAIPASAAAVTVDCGSNPSALQPAIDAAKPGSTLTITGTCVGGSTIAKDLQLKGAPGGGTLFGSQAGHSSALTVSSGTLLLKHLTVTNGSCVLIDVCGGGATGITNAGTLSLQQVTVTGNYLGIDNSGTLGLFRSTVTLNSDAGGILNAGQATIEESTVSGNYGDDGGIYNSGDMTIDASTISGNLGDGGNGGIGNGGTLLITRSTIANNHVSHGVGGGIGNGGSLTVVSSTVVNNRAVEGGNGIYNQGSATITASIFWNPRGVFLTPVDDFACDTGTPSSLTSGGYNVIGSVDNLFDPSGPSCFQSEPTDRLGHNNGSGPIDPKLGVFGGHGGPTATIPIKPNSPALDAIPIGALATDGTPLCPSSGSTDQRGYPRPHGSACDIGAFEK